MIRCVPIMHNAIFSEFYKSVTGDGPILNAGIFNRVRNLWQWPGFHWDIFSFKSHVLNPQRIEILYGFHIYIFII